MAYQRYDNDSRQYGGRHHDYVRTDRPSHQSSQFADPYEDYAYTKRAPQDKLHHDYATYSYNGPVRYENMSYDRYNSVPRGQTHFKHEDYTARHSTSDYISPPVKSRHDYDYILPQHSGTKRYETQQSRNHENQRQYDEPYQGDYSHLHRESRQSRHPEPRVSSRSLPIGKSNDRIWKDSGFDSKHDFMRAHGIKPWDLDAYDEANDILDGFRHVDAQNHHSQYRRARPEVEVSQSRRPRSSHHRYERAVPQESAQSQRTRSSHHSYERTVHRDSTRFDKDYGSDMDTCIDSDVPIGGYISGSDIGSFKSNSSLDRYWSRSKSRSPSLHQRSSFSTGERSWRSVSKSPARWAKTSEYDVVDGMEGSDDEQIVPRGRYVYSSPLTRSRSGRFDSTSRRSRSRVLSSGSSILSYRSSRSPSIFAGSDYFDNRNSSRPGSIHGSGLEIDSASDLSGSASGSEIETADDYDDYDDYLDDGFDEEIEDELEFDDY